MGTKGHVSIGRRSASFQSFRAFAPRNRMKNKGIGLSPLYSVLVFSTQWVYLFIASLIQILL
jgi:hypothetical protein